MSLVEFEKKKLVNQIVYLAERSSKKKFIGSFPTSALKVFKAEFEDLWDQIPAENFAVNSYNLHPLQLEKNREHKDPKYSELISLHGHDKASTLFNQEINFVTHHRAHLFSALAQCPFSKAIVVVSDGIGNRSECFTSGPETVFLPEDPQAVESLSVYLLDNGTIKPLFKKWIRLIAGTNPAEIFISDGFGTLFENVSRLAFGSWMHAGKVMGLAAYGKATPFTDRVSFCRYLDTLEIKPSRSKNEFDSLPRERFHELADLAASVQYHFEESMLGMLRDLRQSHEKFEDLILVGGCALNCLLNDRILKEGIFARVFVPPFPNDEGISLGSALSLAHERGEWEMETVSFKDLTAALGALSSDASVQERKVEGLFKNFKVSRPTHLTQKVASLLHDNQIIGWFQGRGEVGPRALGNRSILVRPDRPGVKEFLNTRVKFREDFRPYGVTILQEKAPEYFQVTSDYQSPFMTFAPKIKEAQRERLAGVVHADGTCRIQTLLRGQNPRFYSLIEEFYRLSGLPVLLNTSMNIMGQPILETTEDALVLFTESGIDSMIIGDYLIEKR